MNVHFSNNALTNDGFSNDGRPRMPAARERGKLTLPWSLLLLGSGYFLLVAGPLWSTRSSVSSSVQTLLSGAAWLPAPAAAGLALLGAAALIFVVARLVRDVEQRPYACIAPVLAVFSGFVLSSVRVDLALPGVTAQQLALLVLALALLGGALVQRDGFSERALGYMLAVLPAFALMLALTAVHGARDPIALLAQVDPSLRTYLLLLAVSALALSAVGAVARRLTGSLEQANSLDAYGEPIMRLPRVQSPVAQAMVPPSYSERAIAPLGRTAESALRPPPRRTSGASTTLRGSAAPGQRHGAAATHSLAGPTSYGKLRATPPTGELSLDDPDLILLTRGKRPFTRGAAIAVLLACTGLVGAYVLVLRPLSVRRDVSHVRSERSTPAAVLVPTSEGRAVDDAAKAAARTKASVPSVESLSPTPSPALSAEPPSTSKMVPLVTSLGADASPVSDDETGARVHRSRRHRDRVSRHRGASSASRASSASPASDEPGVKKPAPASVMAAKTANESAPKPAPAPAVAPKTANESALDLDELVHKALKGGGSSSGADDPLLGL